MSRNYTRKQPEIKERIDYSFKAKPPIQSVKRLSEVLLSAVSYAEAQRMTGIDAHTLRHYAYGDLYPNAVNLRKICIAFNVSADYLLCTDLHADVLSDEVIPPAVKELPKELAMSEHKLILTLYESGFRYIYKRGKRIYVSIAKPKDDLLDNTSMLLSKINPTKSRTCNFIHIKDGDVFMLSQLLTWRIIHCRYD